MGNVLEFFSWKFFNRKHSSVLANSMYCTVVKKEKKNKIKIPPHNNSATNHRIKNTATVTLVVTSTMKCCARNRV